MIAQVLPKRPSLSHVGIHAGKPTHCSWAAFTQFAPCSISIAAATTISHSTMLAPCWRCGCSALDQKKSHKPSSGSNRES